jgi:cytochrome c oxidase cbb3-type subunit 1
MADNPATAAATQSEPAQLVDRVMVKRHIIAAFSYFFIAIFAGMFYALQLDGIYPFAGIEFLSPGRVRMLHTNGVAYGFLFNAFIASLHWIVPRLTGEPVLSRTLSRFVFWAWQLIVLSTALGILGGHAQGIEWGETPVWIDPVVLLGGALLIANVGTPIWRVRQRALYVSLWYFGAMLVWLPLVYAMGNFVPQYWVPGAGGAAVTGLYIHDLVGLTVTPLGWGMMYYFVPVIAKKPVWSHTLSLVGFWGLAFFYPLQGIHHFLFSPIPMYAQYGAVMSTIAIEIVVFTVIVNFFMTLRGRGDLLRTSMPMRWFYTGMVAYFITCLQCAFHTTLTFQRLIHFTDWVVGHAHLVMFGVFGLWFFGMMTYLFPRLYKHGWYSRELCEWHFWLSAVGIFVMSSDLILLGLFQGFYWVSLQPWDASVTVSQPFWIIRVGAGLAIIAGQICFVVNIYKTWRLSEEAKVSALFPR